MSAVVGIEIWIECPPLFLSLRLTSHHLVRGDMPHGPPITHHHHPRKLFHVAGAGHAEHESLREERSWAAAKITDTLRDRHVNRITGEQVASGRALLTISQRYVGVTAAFWLV